MTQSDRAKTFAALHVKGDPVVLYNIWDVGSANAIAISGALALATGSDSVAASRGYGDGEQVPLAQVYANTRRISQAVDLPLSVDFEGAYGREADVVSKNVSGLVEAGAIGVNFEDQIVGSDDLYGIDEQVARIRAVRAGANEAGVSIFINARTDLFLKERNEAKHEGMLAEAMDRAAAYAEAGADGFFVPLLMKMNLIERVCNGVNLPINVMTMDATPGRDDLANIGVARISFGPGPFRRSMQSLSETAKQYF